MIDLNLNPSKKDLRVFSLATLAFLAFVGWIVWHKTRLGSRKRCHFDPRRWSACYVAGLGFVGFPPPDA